MNRMEKLFKRILEILERHRENRLLRRTVSVLASTVVFCTVYFLILPAISLDHNTALKLPGVTLKTGEEVFLECPMQVHEHTEDCYEERPVYDDNGKDTGKTEKVLICGQADYVIHTHDDSCYAVVTGADGKEEKVLICTLEEHKQHTHTDKCYKTQRVLICGKEESKGHTHTGNCYKVTAEVTCGKEEHTHTAACYEEVRESQGCVLVCDYEEGEVISPAVTKTVTDEETGEETEVVVEEEVIHHHTDSCYEERETVSSKLVCGKEEHKHSDDCTTTIKTLTCKKQEQESHTHTDKCFEKQKVIACGELELHTHTEKCYEKGPKGESPEEMGWIRYEIDDDGNKALVGDPAHLVCGNIELKAHQHDDTCFVSAEKAQEYATASSEEAEETEENTEDDGNTKTEREIYTTEDAEPLNGTMSEEAKAQSFTAATDQVTVSVAAEAGTFPEGTTMSVQDVADETTIENITGAVDGTVSYVHAVNITFEDADGKEVSPETAFTVGIAPMVEEADADDSVAVQVDTQGCVQVIETADVSDIKIDFPENAVLFEADGEDTYAIVGTTLEKTVLASDGKNYKVTASFGAETGIPAEAELNVEEITETTQDYRLSYEKYVGLAEKALGWEDGKASYVRLFNIRILDKNDSNKKYQPKEGTKVDVKIELADAENGTDLNVVHFEDGSNEGGKVESITETGNYGQVVCFGADGFSVYAVVDGSTQENARMKLEFYSENNLIATMYVKNGDELLGDEERDPYKQYLEDIIHDPGVGVLESGEVFAGWILDKGSNYSTADIDDAMTIEQIRSWAADQNIVENTTVHRFDAAICKMYTITYKDEAGTILGMGSVPVKSSEFGTTDVSYKVNMAYTPKDDVHNFEGWKLDAESASNVTSTVPGDSIYANGSNITIKGDISFTVNAPAGNWLIFDENGKGGTYNAPQFVKSGNVTVQPRPDAEMTRNGYTFGGWYDTKAHADAHGANPSVTTGRFNFGGELGSKTTLYASWIPNANAPYTVILWGQNLDRTAYEVLGSYVGNGRVGQNIPYNVVNNGDEDYVTGVGTGNGHYTGFSVIDADKNQQIKITPEGDAVLNLHYDRITYNLRIYLYRKGNGNNSYSYAQNSNRGKNVWGIATWYGNTNLNSMPTTTYGPIYSEQNDGYTGYYILLSAYYGEDISAKWPQYSQISSPANNRSPVSFIMMNGSGLKGNGLTDNGYGTGRDTIKGLITTMDEKILGKTNDTNGNYLIVRFNTYNNWRYHIWYETVDGEDYTGKTTHTYNGKTYYEADVLEVRSSNTDVAQQNPPQYTGYEYNLRRNQNWNGEGSWQTTSGGTTYHHINYIYDRLAYPISYFDGNYVDGSGNNLQNRATHLLHESNPINQGAIIPAAYRNYIPELPEGEAGYVFEGWYLDEACNTPYTWGIMPVGGIKVYAKWRQVQYRVFLHPNAGTDENLEWGSENVSTSFRVSYGSKVSTPTGTREGSGYEFVGWYTDPSMSSQYLFNSDMVLNDETVTTAYLKTEDTELDKWGNPVETGNKDAAENRTWITRKLDLYAKWRKILEGAGINIIYTADDGKGNIGSNAPVDLTTYPDQAEATAQAADEPPQNMYFKYWVIQIWDETLNNGQGGYKDTDLTVQPGQQFNVDEQFARKEADPEHPGEYKYTMRLRAEYEQPGENLQTHIWWFDNYSDDNEERHESTRQDENILVNEIQIIKPAPTRNGYKFLGWARIPKTTSESLAGEGTNPPTGKVLELTEDDLYLKYENNQFKLNEPGSEDNGKVVTHVAADEKLDYHDMYAVWEKKTYTVTVIKVTSDVSYQNIPFEFTPSGFPDSVDTGGNDFYLVGNPSGATVDEQEYAHSKVFVDVPYLTEFSISEDAGDYTVTVQYDCADADDNTKNGTNIPSANGQTITVDGNITVTFTNSPKAQKLRIRKIGDDELSADGLAGAVFSLTSSNAEGFTDLTECVSMNAEPVAENLGYLPGNDVSNATLFNLPAGTYTLAETSAPANYYVVGAITISVSASEISVVKGNEEDIVELTGPDANGVYTLLITDKFKTVPLKVVKIDQEGNALAGATFTGDLIEDSVTTTITNSSENAEAIIIDDAAVPLGEYTISETGTPPGYLALDGDVVITIDNNDTGTDIVVDASIGGVSIDSRYIKRDYDTGQRTIEIMNNAGVELPATGGPGTKWIRLLGLLIMSFAIGTGAILKRKQKN